MKIAVLSDTHGHRGSTTAACELLHKYQQTHSLEFAAVLHCGDVGLPHVIVPLLGPFPTHFVFGNNDWDRETLATTIAEQGLFFHGDFGELTLHRRRIAWLHGDDVSRLRSTVESQTYDLVCHGHTHRAETFRHGETTVLNPGALFRANNYTIAVVDLETLSIELLTIDRTQIG